MVWDAAAQGVHLNPADILAQARANYARHKQAPLPVWLVPSDAWRKNLERMAGAIPGFKKCIEVVDFAQRNELSGFDHRNNFSEERCRLQLAAIEQRHPGFHLADTLLAESPWSRLPSLGSLCGRMASNAFLWHLAQLLGLQAVAPRWASVLEIGGGYGGLARLAWLMTRASWTIVDFPESLFFAEVFLRVNDVPVDEQPGVLLTSSIPLSIGTQTLVANCGSFGEMPPATVAGWLAEIERLSIPLLYSCNYAETPFPADLGQRWINVASHHGTMETLLGPSLDTSNAWDEMTWRRR